MKFGLFGVALRNLKRKSFRTAVLIASIGLLVSILVFGASFIISVSSSLKRASDRLGADLLIVPAGAAGFAEEVLLETKSKTFYMDRAIMDKVRAMDGITEVTSQTYLETIWGVCCDVPPAKVVAFNQDTDFIVGAWLDRAIGRRLKRNEAIIGYEASENFGLLEVENSRLFGAEFKIVGRLEKTGTGLDNAIFISDENLAEVLAKGKSPLRPNQISIIFAKIETGLDPYITGLKIEKDLIQVDTIGRGNIGRNIIANLRDINGIFIITILLAFLLSAFLAWTVFSAIVNERLREVSIMRALGARGAHVVKMFVMEVFSLGLVGSLIGIVLGTYLSLSFSRIFSLFRDLAATLTLMERAEIALIGILAGTGICIVGALSPIMRIWKLEPFISLKEI